MKSHIESFYNDCSIIKKSISLTQDRNNIIENILNGQKYVVFDYIINKLTKKMEISLNKSIKNIPYFSIDTFYLPFKNDYHIEDYLYENNQFQFIDSVIYSEDKIIVDVPKSIEKIKKANIKKITHNIKYENQERKEFNNDYYLILDYIKQNYKNPLLKNEAIFLLNFNWINKTYFFEKRFYNPCYKNIKNIFYISNYKADIKLLKPLNNIFFTGEKEYVMNSLSKYNIDNSSKFDKFKEYELDKEKTIEVIHYINNLKNF